ncbi:MAG: DNA-directed RNA polymerase subunit omega [Candidatus Omnitrophica bacterium]|nr:DNA-directed RNA polymerase subunit omega [Candidatus Omnitrophota bacterium]
MTQVAIEELLKRCGSVYKLVILAAKRAKEIAEGAPPLVETEQRKVTSIALEEILHGRVLYQAEEPAGPGKRSRARPGDGDRRAGGKAKEEKKKRAAT